MKLGVLRFQGDVREHLAYFKKAGAEAYTVVTAGDLKKVDALVIPGGESTTISKFIFEEGLDTAIKEFAESGKGIFATCAGLILLSSEVRGNSVPTLQLLDISVERNAYGRQVESFEAPVRLAFDSSSDFNGVFIRAPKIVRIGDSIDTIAWLDEEPVMVRQGKILAATFHPELTDDLRVAKYFLNEVCGGKG